MRRTRVVDLVVAEVGCCDVAPNLEQLGARPEVTPSERAEPREIDVHSKGNVQLYAGE